MSDLAPHPRPVVASELRVGMVVATCIEDDQEPDIEEFYLAKVVELCGGGVFRVAPLDDESLVEDRTAAYLFYTMPDGSDAQATFDDYPSDETQAFNW